MFLAANNTKYFSYHFVYNLLFYFISMNRIVYTALKYEGASAVRYRTPDTGNKPEGFDCSGFFQWVLLESGIFVPMVPTTQRILRHSEEYFDFLGFLVHEPFRQPGDAIFFSKNGYRPSHVGIYVGEGNMIHSPGRDDTNVCVCPVDALCGKDYIKFDSKKGYPQIYSTNPIGYKRVALPSLNRRFQIVP